MIEKAKDVGVRFFIAVQKKSNPTYAILLLLNKFNYLNGRDTSDRIRAVDNRKKS
jgi:hypothetical protein